jgi:hypothetical protein
MAPTSRSTSISEIHSASLSVVALRENAQRPGTGAGAFVDCLGGSGQTPLRRFSIADNSSRRGWGTRAPKGA